MKKYLKQLMETKMDFDKFKKRKRENVGKKNSMLLLSEKNPKLF